MLEVDFSVQLFKKKNTTVTKTSKQFCSVQICFLGFGHIKNESR